VPPVLLPVLLPELLPEPDPVFDSPERNGLAPGRVPLVGPCWRGSVAVPVPVSGCWVRPCWARAAVLAKANAVAAIGTKYLCIMSS